VKRLLFLLAASGLSLFAADQLVPIFDGKTLNGWKVCDGKATYHVEDGAIVGRTVEGSPNTFLCTAKEYGDFVLEFETKTDPALNSGVQIRAHKYESESPARIFNGKEFVDRKFPAGRVYGYQVEIANEKSGASGGIYDEARRGWLHNISDDPAASKAFKDNQWNKYRVEARGDSIKVWVNGVPAADIVDPLDQTGFIGLQVHSFKGPHPTEVRWRNIRIQDLGRHEWKSIWDGRTFDGWTKKGGGNWAIEDGAIHGKSVAGDERIGFILSDRATKDATVRVKFKIKEGNSGFFLRTDPETMASYEVEIDAEKRTGGFWEVRGRNWVTGPEDNAAVKADDWNELTGSLHGHRIVFHLNGVKTVDLPNDTQGRTEGRIALQIHGSKRPTEIWFKDVAILEPVK
jgi:hypothetical protein